MGSESTFRNTKSAPEGKFNLRRSAGPTLSFVDVLRQRLQSDEFQALLELCVRNPGARPALGQHERVEFDETGKVTRLNLTGLPITDLTALVALENLSSLDLSMTPVSDIAPLAQCGKLSRLWLDQTQVRDLAPLADKMLILLMANQTKVTSVDVLKRLPVIEFLGLEGSLISSIDAIGALPSLKQLNLRNTRCGDLSALHYCGSLQTLLAAQCRVRTVTALSGMKELVKLDLSWNQIADSNGLHTLPKLRELNLAGNPLQPRSAGDLVIQLKKLHGDKIRISL